MNSRTAGASFDLSKIFELPDTADKMRVGKHFGASGAAILIRVIFGFLRFVSNWEMGCLDSRKLLKGLVAGEGCEPSTFGL
jgi:hypothetical protein